MNFDNDEAIDALIGRLLAFIIMFQKKIENIKCKISGNQQFHSRLAFQALDHSKKNQISSTNLTQALQTARFDVSQPTSTLFLSRYSKNGSMTYEEFLKLLTPKSNKVLSQGMLIRPYQKGAILLTNLWQWVLQLLQLHIKMCVVTESIRTAIQRSENLSYVELIQFFTQTITSQSSLLNFMSRCSSQEYDIDVEDAIYLSYHLKSGHEISQFTETDIKELLFPLHQNFPRKTTQQTFYKQTANHKENKQDQTLQFNFLGKTYQKMYVKKESDSRSYKQRQSQYKPFNHMQKQPVGNSNRLPSVNDQSSRVNKSYGALYIDNFARQNINPVLQLDHYISSQKRVILKGVQIFHDDFNSNYSILSGKSKQSAFERS